MQQRQPLAFYMKLGNIQPTNKTHTATRNLFVCLFCSFVLVVFHFSFSIDTLQRQSFIVPITCIWVHMKKQQMDNILCALLGFIFDGSK